MTDRLPLNPSIPELFVEDDVGTWVTFDVPAGHHLYGMFVPVDRTSLPADMPVQRVMGNVFGRANKPTMKQIEERLQPNVKWRGRRGKKPSTPYGGNAISSWLRSGRSWRR